MAQQDPSNLDDDSGFGGDNVLDLSPAAFVLNQRRKAAVGAINDLDASPDDAVKATQLARATGAGPATVYGNLENFEQQHKAALASSILDNNSYIRDYIQTHPLGSKIINDDYGQLDAFSQLLQKASGFTTLKDAAKDFAEGFGTQGLMFKPSVEEMAAHPGIGAAAAVADIMSAPLQAGFRAPGGAINAVTQYLRRKYEDITGQPGRDMAEAFLQAISDPGAMASINPIVELAGAGLHERALRRAEIEKVAPYVKAGEVPPPGVSQIIDDARQDENKEFLKSLKDQEREANGTNLIERDPQSFKDFVNQHNPGHIELQADAVRAILGEEPAVPGDGKFGDIPGFNEELALAERHNGHVQVPLADWFLFANKNPDEAEFLRKQFATLPGGVTEFETEAAKEREAALEPKAEEPKPAEGEEPQAQALPAEEVNPHVMAMASVRSAAGLEPIFARQPGIVPETAQEMDLKAGDKTYPIKHFTAGDALKMVDKDQLTGVPRALAEFYHDRLGRAAGNTPIMVVDTSTMRALNSRFKLKPNTPGFYSPDDKAIILRSDVAEGRHGHDVATHLLIHEVEHVVSYNAIEKFPEIRSAIRSVMDETDAFLKEHDPAARERHNYAFTNEHEFAAESRGNTKFQEVIATTPVSEKIVKGLGLDKSATMYDAIRKIVSNLIEKLFGVKPPPTVLDAMFKVHEAIDAVNKGLKEEAEGGPLGAQEREPELPGISRMESRSAFRTPGAVGLKADDMRRYLGLIEKQDKVLSDHIQSKAMEDERKRQTAEWKENEKSVRAEVREGINRRPDIAADRFLREGILEGKKAGDFKLDKGALTDEQVRSLPPDYVRSGGSSPDDMAQLFGYQSGDALVQALAQLHGQRELEGLTPQAHISKMVAVATEHEMQRQYGDLEENILREAKEHVFSSSQIDILADETMHLAALAKSELPITKEDLLKGARQVFDASPLRAVSSKAFEASAGRAGQAVQDALLKGDYRAALKAKQEQTNAAIYANLALKWEKKLNRWKDVDAPRMGRRDPSGMRQEDAVWNHQILYQVLGPDGIQTSKQDLERRKEMSSPYKTLREYVEAKNKSNGTASTDPNNPTTVSTLSVSPDLFSENWPGKAFEGLSVAEARAAIDSTYSINHYGHEIDKYTVKGDKVQLKEVVNGLVERLKAAVDNKTVVDNPHETSVFRNIGSLLLNTETWMNRLDLGNRQGPFNQLIMRPIVEGQYELRQLEKDFAARWKDLGKYPDFNKSITNTLFRDKNGYIEMTKGNAYVVLQNMGNALQRRKLIQGWGIDKDQAVGEQKIWDWLKNTAGMTEEDLARAQKMGKIFNDAFEHSEKAWVHSAGVAPARIELYKVQTPWGQADEWYHPLIADPLRNQSHWTTEEAMQAGESGFWKPSPTAGYTKGRTGAVYPIDLSFKSAAFKLRQILNDAAMRIPITEVGKIVYNKEFQEAFKRYYGPEYHSALDAWMKDSAGNRQWQPANIAAMDRWVNDLAQNMSTMLIGFNPSTVLKHGPTAAIFSAWEVGGLNWASSMLHLIKEMPGSRQTWDWVMDSSEEARNRLHHIEDTLSNQNRELFSDKKGGIRGKITSLRDAVSWYGHYPVGFADLISAVAMFHAEYKRLNKLDPTMSEGDLRYAANTAIRRTHGSSIVSNRSGIQRHYSPYVRLSMPFYNFLGNALQRNYENAWMAKLAVQGREVPEMTGFLKEKFEAGPQHIKRIIGGVMVFGFAVGLTEWLASKLMGNAPKQKSDESDAAYWGKQILRGYSAQVPLVSGFANSLIDGHDPAIGLYGTIAHDIGETLKPKNYNPRNPGKALRTGLDALAITSGLTTAPADKLAEYVTNVLAGHEHPKGFGDLWQGATHGTQQAPRR